MIMIATAPNERAPCEQTFHRNDHACTGQLPDRISAGRVGLSGPAFYGLPQFFQKQAMETISAYDVSHWTYDEAFGYAYPPGRRIHLTTVSADGTVAGCETINSINERGNIGPIEGDYEQAALKIAVFGDSWAAFHVDGMTWTDIFQREMTERLGKPVHVLNFGRDGYGILQMFDLAAHEVGRWKPDLVIVGFITNDLARRRTWRLEVAKDEVTDRILTLWQPVSTGKDATAMDTFIVHADATAQWCERARSSQTKDEVVAAIQKKWQRALGPGKKKYTDIMALDHSFLFSRLAYGSPFHGLGNWQALRPLEIDSYTQDERFMRAQEKLASYDIPTLLFHHAFYPEVIKEQEFIVNYQEQSLLDSLLAVTGLPMVTTLDNTDLPVENPEALNTTPDDYHPSLKGMEFYSDALTRALIDKQMLPKLLGAHPALTTD